MPVLARSTVPPSASVFRMGAVLVGVVLGVGGCGGSSAVSSPAPAVESPAGQLTGERASPTGGNSSQPSTHKPLADSGDVPPIPSTMQPGNGALPATTQRAPQPAASEHARQQAERLDSFRALGREAAVPDAEVRPAVDDRALAAVGIRRIDGRHLTLLTDLPAGVPGQESIDELPAAFDAAVPEWCRILDVPLDRLANWRMVGHLMKDRTRFERAGLLPASLPPFLNGYQVGHEFWWYEQETDYYRRHLMLHEGTHAVMSRLFGGGGPPWFKEGMAELLATHTWQDGQLRMAVFPATKEAVPGWGRIKIVQDEFAAGRGLSLLEIMRYDLHAHLRNEPYGWSWAACAFLSAHPRSSAAFHALREHASDASIDFSVGFQRAIEEDWPLLNHQWHVFIAELQYGYDVAREAIEPREETPTANTADLQIAADRGWQSTGIRVEAGQTIQIEASGRFQLDDEPSPWWSEANGVTIHYHRSHPLGMLMAAVADERTLPTGLSPLVSPRPIGLRGTFRADQEGVLFLRLNDSPARRADNVGQVRVRVVLAADSSD